MFNTKTLVHFEMVDRSPNSDLTEQSAEMETVPRKGESIVIGKACFLINDIIWHLAETR